MSPTTTNYYFSTGTVTDGTGWTGSFHYDIQTDTSVSVKMEPDDKGKISPQLYFTYVKTKFNFLEKYNLDRRIKKIEAAFDEAMESGQSALGEKILNNLIIEFRESLILAKNVSHYIERDELNKYKSKIKGGHISDTLMKDFTRAIPKPILEKVKKLQNVFDDFVIYHYYEPAVEQKLEKKQKMTSEEKGKMRDPIIFGIIKETNRLYFIEDWIDELCDLTFDDIVDSIGEQRISKNPKL